MSIKILYAAGDRVDAEVQLLRFLNAVKETSFVVKIAGFKRNHQFLLDWNLEALRNFMRPDKISFDNDVLERYHKQVKAFDPDIIISDLEFFTNFVGDDLNKPIWQVSPSLLYWSVVPQEKVHKGIYKNYSHLFDNHPFYEQLIKNAIYNAQRVLVYSPFGDTDTAPKLKDYIEWVRPYHIPGKLRATCQHNVVAATIKNDKKFVNLIRHHDDIVLFSRYLDETFEGLTLKDINNLEEYGCNLFNCNYVAHAGYTDFLSDAFYNGKQSIIHPNFFQRECVVNSFYAEHLGLGKIFYKAEEVITQPIKVDLKDDIKLLHEKLLEI